MIELKNKRIPNAIIFVGNGFDVAHGLKTKYSDFYKDCSELKILVENGNLLCQHILDNVKGEMWQDLECGLYTYSQELTHTYGEGDKSISRRFQLEFQELRKCLFSYVRKAINADVTNNPGHFVEELSDEWQKLNYQILSFNYSYVVAAYTQKPKNINDDFDFSPDRIIFQHGSLYNPDRENFNSADSIVLGIDDSQKVEESHSFLYKSLQNIHNIKDFIRLIRENRIYIIYGCSMGPSDAFYFNQLFDKKAHDKTFIIYGYGAKELESIRSKIFEYTGGTNMYIAETNNELLFIDCSNEKKALSMTREIINTLTNYKYK